MTTRAPHPCSVLHLTLCLVVLVPWLRADAGVEEEEVDRIRARYNEIEGAKLRRETVAFESEEELLSGTCTAYYEGDEVVKIHLSYTAGDHGGSDEFFYYGPGGLFFVFASDNLWRFTGETRPNGEGVTIDTVVEDRLYLVGGKVVRHLRKEASAKDRTRLPALLREARNLPQTDPERVGELVRHGQGVKAKRTPKELERLLVGLE